MTSHDETLEVKKMEFPVFTLDVFGSGTLIALVAIVHVIVSHGAAVGGSVMTVALETWGMRKQDEQIDRFAYRFLKVLFIVTTSLGAMTGVGIWLTTGVVQPSAIGSMLRVFFWFWFAEWIVFMLELSMLVLYFFTWERFKGEKKRLHRNIGIAYAASSWLTMVIITGILAFMLTPGGWLTSGSRLDAFFNPTYLPSLAFRTFLALAMAAGWTMWYSHILLKRQNETDLRARVIKFSASILLGAGVMSLLTGWWYYANVPGNARQLIKWATAMNNTTFNLVNYSGILMIILIALLYILRPRWNSVLLSGLVIILTIFYVGEIEMVRESIRKPYVINEYMYANGIRVDDVKRFNREGILANSNFVATREVTQENELLAGEELFRIECQSCHVLNNPLRQRRDLVFRLQGWNEDMIYNYVKQMHTARQFMPPFIGTDEELRALSKYLATLSPPVNTTALDETNRLADVGK